MTLVSQTVRHVFTGNGSTVAYATGIQIVEAEDLVIEVTEDDVTTVLQLTSDYDVTISAAGYATVTFVEAPADGVTVVIYRDTDATQETALADNARLRSEALEQALDKLTALVQELRDALLRAPLVDRRLPVDDQLTIDPPEAGMLLRARTDGTGWEHVEVETIDPNAVTLPLAIADGGTGATTASAARAALGVGNTSLEWIELQELPSLSGIKDDTAPATLRIYSDEDASAEFGALDLQTRNTTPTRTTMGRLVGRVSSRSAGAEDATVELQARRSGSLGTELTAGGGIVVGSAAGGAQGAGTVNATEFYKDGAALSLPTYDSMEVTISNGAYFTADAPHELGIEPNVVEVFLRCMSAEHGYSSGDRVTFFSSAGSYSVWYNTTTVGINLDGGFRIRHKTSNSTETPDPAKWILSFRVGVIPLTH